MLTRRSLFVRAAQAVALAVAARVVPWEMPKEFFRDSMIDGVARDVPFFALLKKKCAEAPIGGNLTKTWRVDVEPF